MLYCIFKCYVVFRWFLVTLSAIIWLMRLVIIVYHLYYAYDTKLFYNNALKIKEVSVLWFYVVIVCTNSFNLVSTLVVRSILEGLPPYCLKAMLL